MTEVGPVDGMVALITGAGGGIGAAVAARLAQVGFAVALADLNQEELRKTSDSIGSHAATYLLDATDPVATTRTASAIEDDLGPLTALVQCVGTEGEQGYLHELDPVEVERVWRINTLSYFNGMKAVLPFMYARGYGSVVNIASGFSLRGSSMMGAYVMSKHAVLGLTRVGAAEAGNKNVRVNAICPGPVDTRMMSSIETGLTAGGFENMRDGFEKARPIARYARSEEVAAVVGFLCGPDSAYVTGAAWTVDGGLSAV